MGEAVKIGFRCSTDGKITKGWGRDCSGSSEHCWLLARGIRELLVVIMEGAGIVYLPGWKLWDQFGRVLLLLGSGFTSQS